MLTYPSDPLPHIVCPMDEVAVPQNHFCRAPVRSEPSPPLPLFSSITPSSANDGISGNRRSDGVQRVRAETPEKQSMADAEAVPKLPAQNLSLPKRRGESGRMVQAWDATHPRTDGEHKVAFKDGFDAGLPEDGQNLQKTSLNQTNVSPAATVAALSPHTSAHNLDIAESDMDACGAFVGGCDIPAVSSPNKWVVGPLFQSLKAKISSFSEIIITPVKVFRASSSLPSTVSTHDHDKHPSGITRSALGGVFDSQAQSDREAEDMNGAHEEQTVHKCCKKLKMDLSAPNSEQTDECPTTGTEKTLFVALQRSPSLCAASVAGFQSAGAVFASSVPLYLSVAVSASRESKVSVPSAEEELEGKRASQLKPLLRKAPGNGKKAPSKTLKADLETETADGRSLQSGLSDSGTGRIVGSLTDNQPLHTQTHPAVGQRGPKRDLKVDAPSEDAVKRKRARADGCSLNAQELPRPRRKRPAGSAGAERNGKLDGETLTAPNEAERFGPPAPETGGGPEDSWKGSSRKGKPKQTRRPKAGDAMDVETTIQIRSTKRTPAEGLAEVLCQTRELHRTRKRRENAKDPGKGRLCVGSENTPLPVEPLKVKPAGTNAFDCGLEGHGCKVELKRLSERPKKDVRSSKEEHLRTKEDGSGGVCFERSPCGRSPPSGPLPDCYVKLELDVMLAGDARASEGVADEASGPTGESTLRSGAGVSSLRSRPRTEKQRRTGGVLHGRHTKAEAAACVSKDDCSLAAAGRRSARRRLLRSLSCPEISALRSSDAPWSSLQWPHHARIQPSHQHRSGPPFPHPARRSVHRARRHTVCSVELERDLAPLCLRKEVYPSRRSAPCDASGHALSPSTSLSALASCFLSSPLAFLSKRGASAGPGSSSHGSSPASSSFLPPSPTTKHLSGFIQQPDPSGATMEPRCESEQGETEGGRECEGDDDGENTSSSSQELEDVGLREEKALSDSEVKVLRKHEERGKVSSIRIRKTLPKAQNNLTPMGLPKAVRVKKKDFSLEEIYTNKNFNKPRESRLETIFEVPTSRRNGSVSSFGQKRVKRFLEFPEVGEARKPKKPLVGVGKAGAAASRTRRGGFAKDAAPLGVQDVDSLLCAKLHQLNLWLSHDQAHG